MSSIRPEIDFLKSNKVLEKKLNALYDVSCTTGWSMAGGWGEGAGGWGLGGGGEGWGVVGGGGGR